MNSSVSSSSSSRKQTDRQLCRPDLSTSRNKKSESVQPLETTRQGSKCKQARLLPESFQPSPHSVIIGKGRISKGAEGNIRLKALAATFLDKYDAASTKAEKSEIVSTIVNVVRSRCPTAAFVKQDEQDGRWYECPNGVAREKIGYCFRDLLHDKYKSSSASKAAMRRLVKQNRLGWRRANVNNHSNDTNKDNGDDYDKNAHPTLESMSSKAPPNAKTTGESLPSEGEDISNTLSMTYADLEPLPINRLDEEKLQQYNQYLSMLNSGSLFESAMEVEENTASNRNLVGLSAKWYEDMEALVSVVEKDETPLNVGNLLDEEKECYDPCRTTTGTVEEDLLLGSLDFLVRFSGYPKLHHSDKDVDPREKLPFICVYFGISLHLESMISSTRHSTVKPIANGHMRPKRTLLRNESTNTNDAILGEQAAQQPSLIPKSFTSSLGPVSLMGGTAAIYTSLLQHPSSSLTQFSFVFMMLLAIQYALQPRLSRRYISPNIDKQSVALVEEIVKTGMAAAIVIAKPATEVQNALKDWTLSSSLAVAGLPAMLYAIQGVLQYVSYQHLDSVTFNGLTQTKTLSAAFCCWLIMGKQQSPVQMVALGILFGSALVFQGYIRPCGKKPEQSTTAADTKTNKGQDDWLWRGIFPCLAAAFLSGLAGALSQKGLQMTGIQGRDPFLYTVEISFYSAVSLLLNMMLSSKRLSKLEWHKQSTYWNWKTLIPIIVKAAGGVITALVHKYAGSVSKGFALMFGLVLSNMIQLTTKQESLQPYQVWGTLMIMSSTWLFFTH
ncbi:nucleotide-sugar transporter [Nitzschia inconspicua]|uniref:Nucleotide-sugar transporter n=1 Tax=Nitzschia inconspicua TaxID=303405 RepID=A0A9K3PXR1_9STRA|nr:nucleotide-sugar transporter [Nitzschia inconspicua]